MSNLLLTRIFTVYGSPEIEDADGWMAEASRQLDSFPKNILDKAATALIRSSKRFPSIAAMIEACNDAAATEPQKPDKEKYPEWSKAAIAAADRLVVSDLGRQAAEEGWSLSLHDYCRVHRQLPDAAGIARCKRISRDFDDAYANAMKIEGPFGKAAVAFGDSMLKRRHEIADRSNGILPDGDRS